MNLQWKLESSGFYFNYKAYPPIPLCAKTYISPFVGHSGTVRPIRIV